MNERYKEYLKSGEWKFLKDRKLKQVNYTCEGCGEKHRVLDLHHRTYERIGMELLSDLQVLCRECHDIVHGNDKSEWHKYLKGEINIKPKDRLAIDIQFEKELNSYGG